MLGLPYFDSKHCSGNTHLMIAFLYACSISILFDINDIVLNVPPTTRRLTFYSYHVTADISRSEFWWEPDVYCSFSPGVSTVSLRRLAL